ncbi:hypothetical protein QW180_17440 [Vibrio sinaloensis]|nr:hypothetical protein [Vibrio sinaloensis]
MTPLIVEIYNKGTVTLNMSDPDSDGVSLVSVLHPKEVEVQYDQHGDIDVTALTEGSFKLTAIVEDDRGMQAHKEFEVNASRNDIPTILPNALIAPPVTRYEAEQAGLHIVSEYVNSLNNYPLVRSTALDAQEYCQKQGLSVLSTSLVEGWEAKSAQDIANVVGSFQVFAWDKKNANLVRMNTSDKATSTHSDNQIVMCAGHPRGIRYTLDVPSLDLGLPATISVIAEDQQGSKWPMDLSSGKLECTPECDVTATTVTPMNQESKEVKWIGPSGITVVGLGTVAPFEMKVDMKHWARSLPRDGGFTDIFLYSRC